MSGRACEPREKVKRVIDVGVPVHPDATGQADNGIVCVECQLVGEGEHLDEREQILVVDDTLRERRPLKGQFDAVSLCITRQVAQRDGRALRRDAVLIGRRIVCSAECVNVRLTLNHVRVRAVADTFNRLAFKHVCHSNNATDPEERPDCEGRVRGRAWRSLSQAFGLTVISVASRTHSKSTAEK